MTSDLTSTLDRNVVIIRGDARALPLPDASVDLIVTSPPYFGLRSYQDGGEHYGDQIGAEESPQAYLEALWDCTREWVRVLKPTGSLWINLGDKYATKPGQFGPQGKTGLRAASPQAAEYITAPARQAINFGVAPKSLTGLPWRYAIGCIDQLGLILRAEVIWDKPSALPESVTDRVRRSHEQWFHFTLRPRYYSAVDEIRQQHARDWRPGRNGGTRPALAGSGSQYDGLAASSAHPLGALPGSVWEIASQPLSVPDHLGVDHFAAFPLEFPRRIIRGWSPAGLCTACGEGRRPVTDVQKTHAPRPSRVTALTRSHGQDGREGSRPTSIARITGYACACLEPIAPTRAAVVLDPFGGTGTTALVASVLGRRGVSVDRSADYCRIAQWRTTDRGEIARAMQVAKPPAEVVGQPSLFDEEVPDAS